jgi:hypothetical protein
MLQKLSRNFRIVRPITLRIKHSKNLAGPAKPVSNRSARSLGHASVFEIVKWQCANEMQTVGMVLFADAVKGLAARLGSSAAVDF